MWQVTMRTSGLSLAQLFIDCPLYKAKEDLVNMRKPKQNKLSR